MSLAVASCIGGAEPTTIPTTTTTTTTTLPRPTTTTEPKPDLHGGTVVIGLLEEPLTLNPLFAGEQGAIVGMIAQAWSVGVQDVSGETGDLIPEVLERLPTVANGGVALNADGTMTVTYDIREDAVWANGVPITGSDFQFTLDSILSPSVPADRSVYSDIVSSVVGEKTFSYTLAVPTMQYEMLFDVLIPEHDVGGTNLALQWDDHTWISGGPFVFEEWVPGERITFSRNDAYWKEQDGDRLPYFDRVEFRFLPDPGQLHSSFLQSDLDVAQLSPTTDEYQALLGSGASVESEAGPVWVHLNFQFGPERLDRNPDTLNEYLAYRKAVMHAVDRQRIVDALYAGRIGPLDSYVSAYNPTVSQGAWSQYAYDPEAAKTLIAEADAERDVDENRRPGDLEVIFTRDAGNADRDLLAQLLGEMLTAVGVDYIAVPEDSLVFFGETVSEGRWDMASWAWQASPGLAALVRFHDVLDPEDARATTNFYRWGTFDSSIQDAASIRYGQLLSQMRTTVDATQLTALIGEVEQLVADEALFLPLYAEPVTAAYWPEAVSGFVMNGTEAGFTWNIEHWHVPPG